MTAEISVFSAFQCGVCKCYRHRLGKANVGSSIWVAFHFTFQKHMRVNPLNCSGVR